MDLVSYFRVVLALAVTLALILIFYLLLRRYLQGKVWRGGSGDGRRLQVVEVAALDSRRRALLLRRDTVEHLIIIGGQNDVVVETAIAHPPSPAEEETP